MSLQSWRKLLTFCTCKFLCTCNVHILIRIKLKFSRKVVIVSLNICVKFQNKQTRHLSTVLLQSWQKLPIFQWRPTWWRHQVMMTSSRKVYTCSNAHAKRLSFRRAVRNCSIYSGSRNIRVVNLLVSVIPVCIAVYIKIYIYNGGKRVTWYARYRTNASDFKVR